MKTRTNLLVVFFILALLPALVGCATLGFLQHMRKHSAEAEFKAAPDIVYKATMLMLERNFFKIDEADPQARRIQTKEKIYPAYRRYDLPVWNLKINAVVEPRGEGEATVKLLLDARVQPRDILEMVYKTRPETLIEALAEEYLESIKKIVEAGLGKD